MTSNKNESWVNSIKNLIEAILNALGQGSTKKRTWNQHVVPYKNGWAVKREGNKRITSKHRKQSTAINKAKVLAKRYDSDVIIHREDGTIRDRISYRED